jgi:type IV pilus assembly protein PilB
MGDPRPGGGTTVAGFPAGARGVTPPLNPDRRGRFLSDVIVELGLADRETVDHAVRQSRPPGQRLGGILLETGALTEDELSRAVAERHGLDHVDFEQFDIDLGAATLISASAACRYDAIPIAFAAGGALIVALEDPLNPLVIDDLEVMTKSEVRIAVATGTAIRSEIEALERRAADGLSERRAGTPAGR